MVKGTGTMSERLLLLSGTLQITQMSNVMVDAGTYE